MNILSEVFSLQLLLIFLAILTSLSVIIKYIVWYFHRPKIRVHLSSRSYPLHWTELNDAFLTIANETEHRYRIEWEIRTNNNWKYRNKETSKLYNSYSRNGLFAYKRDNSGGKPVYLSKNDVISHPFPFKPENEETHIEIVVFPHVDLSEFTIPILNIGVPDFYPEIQLKSIKSECVVLDDLSTFAMVHEPARAEQLSETLSKIEWE